MAKKNNLYQGKESDFQKTVAMYLDMKNAVWCHCPNGGTRNAREASYLKKEGVKSGVPDILIFNTKGINSGLAIELKVFPNKMQPSQKEWAENLTKCGWQVECCYSLDECIDIIDNYFNK